jgi:ACT domain-containing protein
MTKGALLKDIIGEINFNIISTYVSRNKENCTIKDEILLAMDQYAKDQAIAFAEYLEEWGWEMCDLNGHHSGKWVSGMNIQYGFKSIHELYTQFIELK